MYIFDRKVTLYFSYLKNLIFSRSALSKEIIRLLYAETFLFEFRGRLKMRWEKKIREVLLFQMVKPFC